MSDIFLGRCRHCKLVKRFLAPVVRERGVLVRGSRPLRTAFDRERDVSAAAPFVPRSEFDRKPAGVGEYFGGVSGVGLMTVGGETMPSGLAPGRKVLTQTEYHDRGGALWLVCPEGHSVEFKRIVGRKSDEECSAKCQSATGNVCECACAGENHGVNHG